MTDSYADANWILFALASMMLTYSLGDDIYTEILIPQKRERHYLIAMLFGVLINVSLSFILAIYAFPTAPGIGVALATMVADILVLAYLLFVSRDYSLPAILNLNNLKIAIFGIAIFVISYFLLPVLENQIPWGDQISAHLLSSLIVLSVDALIYIFGLLAVRETLISSVFRRKDKNNESESARQ